MSNERSILPPVPDEYFARCIAGAECAGLRLIGRATIDSTSHAMRRNVVIVGTGVPTVLFLRHTTLLFSYPGSAFLATAVCVEKQIPDYQAAYEGRVVPTHYGFPYWKLALTCGTLPGRWELGERWLYVAEMFDATKLYISEIRDKSKPSASNPARRIDMRFISRSLFDEERDVCDGRYDVLLGSWRDIITPILFAGAMNNMVEALRPHLRTGKLLKGTGLINLLPLAEFPACAETFLAQCPPECLLETLDEIPYWLQSPERIAERVEVANRVYNDG
jgi:hypothetical protein